MPEDGVLPSSAFDSQSALETRQYHFLTKKKPEKKKRFNQRENSFSFEPFGYYKTV